MTFASELLREYRRRREWGYSVKTARICAYMWACKSAFNFAEMINLYNHYWRLQ